MKKIPSIVITVLGLFWLPLAAAGFFEYTEHRVTDTTLYETTPTLGHDGTSNLVVYTARELLSTGQFDQADIYYRRLDAGGAPIGNPVRVTSGLTDDYLNDISGDYIVFVAFDEVLGNAGTVMLYRISTGQLRALGISNYIRAPKIHGHYVVWLQGAAGATEVILYDINTNIFQAMAGPAPPKFYTQIGSRFIVWASVDGDFDIEVFDFKLGAHYAITSTSNTQEQFSATSGDWLVWHAADTDSPTGRIEAYNGQTGELRIIANNDDFPISPNIDGELITYEAQPDGNVDVLVHNLSTGLTENVTNDPGDQYLNDVHGDLVAYVDRRSGDGDIYVMHLNERPVVNPGIDQTVNRGQTASLDGTQSYDPDGDNPLSYLWKVEFAPGASTAQPVDPTAVVTSFVPDVLGFYTITLTVTDAQGAHGGPEWIVVSTVNAAPVADAGPDQVIEVLGTQIEFDGSQCYDPDGDAITLAWALEQVPDGSTAVLANATTTTPSFYADLKGDYVARLTVTDSFNEAREDTATASFNNLAPVADAGTSQSATVGDTVTLDGSGSSDANDPGGIYPLSYLWRFITTPDGNTAAITPPDANVATFVPNVPGLYIVELIVNDGELDSVPSIIQVLVVSEQTTIIGIIRDGQIEIGLLDPGVFKNKNLQSTLNGKLNEVIGFITDGNYVEARDKLVHDIIAKTNGCATDGAPDKNDWLKDCESQAAIYPLILEAITLLDVLIGG